MFNSVAVIAGGEVTVEDLEDEFGRELHHKRRFQSRERFDRGKMEPWRECLCSMVVAGGQESKSGYFATSLSFLPPTFSLHYHLSKLPPFAFKLLPDLTKGIVCTLMASTLPSEVVLHILNFNLSPRSLRTRTAHLLTYCLLNRHFQSYYQPQLLEHLHLEGSGLRIGMQLGVIRYLLAVGGEKARLGVKTITCSLTPGIEEVSYTLLRTVNMCEGVTELVLERMVEVDLSSMLSKLRKWDSLCL